MDLSELVRTVSEVLRTKKLRLTTAESCTGGLIASLLTDLAGSSDIFDRGFVTYSNQSKIDMLGVSPLTIDEHGAVSALTAAEMAKLHSYRQLEYHVQRELSRTKKVVQTQNEECL